MSDAANRIDEIVKKNDVVLFMKGTPLFPQCGFSSRAVTILEHLGLNVNRLIRLAYGPFALGTLAVGEIEEVGPRVIREQLAASRAVDHVDRAPLVPDAEMRQLLRARAPQLPDALVRQILEHAGGVPLYAVEVVRIMADRPVAGS
mgnify:CR=1 FL=1